jgi:hypothetical protein
MNLLHSGRLRVEPKRDPLTPSIEFEADLQRLPERYEDGVKPRVGRAAGDIVSARAAFVFRASVDADR